MKVKEIILKGLVFSGLVTLFASCATLNTAQQPFPDDVYGRNAEVATVTQNNNTANNNQEYDEQAYDDQYYGDESYGDYYDGYSDGLSYANRISRFYYGTPGLPYYDPWINNWGMYSPYGSSFYLGFGLGSSWYNPYFGFSSIGWGYPYGSYWGPYSYYGGGYYGGGYYGGYYGGYPIYGNRRTIRTRPSNLGTDNVVRTTRPSRGTINTGSASRSTNARTSVNGDRLQRTRSSINGTARPSVESSRGTVRTTRPSATQRPTSETQGTSRPATTRPAPQARPAQQPQSRPTQARPAPSRPSYTPSSSSAPSRSSGSGGGGARSTRSR